MAVARVISPTEYEIVAGKSEVAPGKVAMQADLDAHANDESRHVTRLPTNHFTANVPGEQYPEGFSVFAVSAVTGWPTTHGLVETVQEGRWRITQWITTASPTRTRKWFRSWHPESLTSDRWSEWTPVSTEDTGWINLVPVNGFTLTANGNIAARRIGNNVQLAGWLHPATTANAQAIATFSGIIATILPQNLRPSLASPITQRSTLAGHIYTVDVRPSGNVHIIRGEINGNRVAPPPDSWLYIHAIFQVD